MSQAKDSMKELKNMVDQQEAKAMGFNNYEVYKPLRCALIKPGKKADQIYKRAKVVMKTLEENEKKSDSIKEEGEGEAEE